MYVLLLFILFYYVGITNSDSFNTGKISKNDSMSK